MAMTKAEKQQMESLAIGAQNVAKANDILARAIKKVIKEKSINANGSALVDSSALHLKEALVDSSVLHLREALDKVKGGVVVKKKAVSN